MNKPKKRFVVVSPKELDQKLDFEIKRLLREKEEGITKYVSKKAFLNGNSTLVFQNKAGEKITLSYRLDKDGNLRFARENQPISIQAERQSTTVPSIAKFGRASKDIQR